ncbi:girdin isoform X1 [Hermetia illucens]|nr:girdin isoform X1 [Hermetia illucens]
MSLDKLAVTAGEMASSAEIEDFLHGALVSWIESCIPRPEILSGYQSLLDGSIVHSIWLQIDPEPPNHLISLAGLEGVSLANGRAKNFDAIIRNLKLLYEEELGQTILVLPDCFTLGYFPESKGGLEQLKILITLLLGAAVQCPNKEIFIGRIKELNVETQHKIVGLIKQVTDSHSLVLTQESLEALPPSTMYSHIITLTRERDSYYSKWISSLTNEPDAANSGSASSPNASSLSASGISLSPSSTESNHMAVELADLKSRIRKLRQELEEKSEAFIEVKEELDHKISQYEKLRTESHEWYQESKKATAYRDEVDILRERAERADRLEVEVQRIREKLTDAEFYKTRVEELREDNRMLLETKEMLEEQLQRSRKRSEQVMTLESEIIRYKQKLNDMSLERDIDKNKLQELLEENAQLQLATKTMTTSLEDDKYSSENEECNSGDNSLSEQLTNNAQTRVLKLELENRRLLAALEQLKESSFHESTNKILELEKEKKKLTLMLDQTQENYNRVTQQNKELEDVFQNALEENKKLQDVIDARQKAQERQNQDREVERAKIANLESHVDSLSKEKQRIQSLFESIQRRADDMERLLEAKTKEVESLEPKTVELDNAKSEIYDLQVKIGNIEKENLTLSKEVNKLKESVEAKSVQLDECVIRNEVQSKELTKLQKELEESSLSTQKIQELEKQNQDLLSQQKIDQETINTLREDLVTGTLATNKVKHNLEKLGLDDSEIENSDLNVEHVVEKLVKNPETFKTVCEVMLNCTKPNTKSDMCVLCHRQEIFTVEKNIEISDASEEVTNQLTVESDGLKSKEQSEQLRASNMSLQSDNDILRGENARLNVDVSTLSSQITSLNTQHVALQLANSQLAADKDALMKQIESMKQNHKVVLQDQVTLQCLHDQLSVEYESLNKDKEALKSVVRDLRNENRDLKEKTAGLEKKLADLRTEMTTMKSSTDDLAILRAEHSKLTDDFRNLFATSDRFKNEYKNIQEQYKMLRAEHGRLKLQNTELTGELNIRIDQLNSLEIEYAKVVQRCDMLLQMNSNLDTDRKTLMDNVSQLLTQYHELLTHSLEDKQHYHDEEKNYTDRVNSLNRQKEKLEEKIMEHYKKSESCAPKKKAFGSSFVKRVKKASTDLMNKVPSRHRRSWIDDARLTQSQFNLGSESGGNESDNSTEEPLSISSNSHLVKDPSLREKFSRRLNDSIEKPFLREGIRNSLQSPRREEATNSRRNSMLGLEPPDVTGSSLTLGTAGSRRTVYLIDENQKISETGSNNTSDAPTPTNNPNENQSTYLIYNRINTMIGGAGGVAPDSPQPSGSNGISSPHAMAEDKSTTRKREEEKTSSIWYEYGCV